MVYIEGRIKTRKWTDDKGIERYSTEIQCSDFNFLTTKKEKQGHPSSDNSTSQISQEDVIEEKNDDLPF
jgi:single-strand DNA-binding protein